MIQRKESWTAAIPVCIYTDSRNASCARPQCAIRDAVKSDRVREGRNAALRELVFLPGGGQAERPASGEAADRLGGGRPASEGTALDTRDAIAVAPSGKALPRKSVGEDDTVFWCP
ncbi:hypothetical protein AAFF_G00278680 [Aldrovandia affinis]|uniref:Uncharacterized protein n=1 Tax=Aldrovandia affinis TaxID=143900 RepID=A0AAD7WT17_9TELE|nr:hypothetical protein AAFF_G00278680 [Aldrovandia affinis]